MSQHLRLLFHHEHSSKRGFFLLHKMIHIVDFVSIQHALDKFEPLSYYRTADSQPPQGKLQVRALPFSLYVSINSEP